jgi:mannose-6-phosphate isomerase-like protein (cupin superfamily)
MEDSSRREESMNDKSRLAPRLVREDEAPTLVEDGEFVRLYLDDARLQFSVAEMDPGARGPVDPGHEDADEVAYVIRGELTIEFADSGVSLTASAGEAIIIPAGASHEPINRGTTVTIFSWSLAPNRSPAIG